MQGPVIGVYGLGLIAMWVNHKTSLRVVHFLGLWLTIIAVNPNIAHAQTAPRNPVDAIKLKVVAQIPARCGIVETPAPPAGAVDLLTSGSFNMPFKVDCNQPFLIRMSSSNGGFALTREGTRFGFGDFKPYDVTLNVGMNDQTNLVDTCSSQLLNLALAPSSGEGMGMNCPFYGTAPRRGLSSGARISTRDAASSNIKISWSEQSGARRLLAGSYRDTLTIAVEPRM
jgi:hypothetical protein